MKRLYVLLLCACSAPMPSERISVDEDSAIPVTRYTSPSGQSAGVILQIPAASTDPQQAADSFLDEYGGTISVYEPVRELRYRETQTHESAETVVYEAMQDGRPVYGAEVRVIIVDGDVVYAGGSRPTDDSLLGEPSLGQDEASALFLAENNGGEDEGAWAIAAEGRLVAFNLGALVGHPTSSALAWQLDVSNGFEGWHVFIDAVSGEEITRVPRFGASTTTTRSLTGLSAAEIDALKRSEYDDNSVMTHQNGEQVDGAPITADAERATEYLHEGLDYFERVHGRDGWNDDCGHIDLYVDINGLNNALWSGAKILFDPIYLAEDVMIHELTHGVVAGTANLHYSFESGALNESLADFFAEAAVADGNWIFGENTPRGTFRSFSDPEAFGQPAHYRHRRAVGSFDDCSTDLDCPVAGEHCISDICLHDVGDHGWVHGNSGVMNYALYLLSEGGTAPESGVVVEGIGTERAAELVFQVLTTTLGPNTTFAEFRVGMHLWAQIFAALPFNNFSASECSSVLNAFAAVGIGAPDGDGDCVPDDIDNCPCIANRDQDESTCDNVDCDGGCYLNRDCGSCGAEAGCGWCDGECHEADEQQMCTRRSFEVCAPDACTTHADCRSCSGDTGCGWCEGSCQATTSECVSATGAPVPFAGVCSVVECPGVSTCGACTDAPGCEWCGDACISSALECDRPWWEISIPGLCPGEEVDCRPGTDCAACTAITGCGWGARGCDIASAPGVSSDPAECSEDPCGLAADCLECTETPGCGWGGDACISAAPGSEGVTTRAAECYDCSGLSDCESCASNGFCEWCGGGCGNTYENLCENPTPVLEC